MFDQNFKDCWNFSFEIKLLVESKYSICLLGSRVPLAMFDDCVVPSILFGNSIYMRNYVIFYYRRILKMLFCGLPVTPHVIPIDTKEVDWNNSSKILCMKDATRMSLYVCHHRPPLNCRQRTLGRLPEVWGRWNRGVNLNLGPITLLSDFPTRSGIYWAPIVYLFVCLRLCRLPFHWVHLFLSCSHVAGSLLNSLSISFWGAGAHN